MNYTPPFCLVPYLPRQFAPKLLSLQVGLICANWRLVNAAAGYGTPPQAYSNLPGV